MRIAAVLLLIFGLSILQTGCGGDKDKGKKTVDNHEGHDHGGHDHIGANNPHKIELKDAPFNALWEHAGSLVTFRIVDNEYKKETAIAATEIVIDDGKNTFKVPALKKNEKGEAAVFELEDKKLEVIMDHEPKFTVKVGDKSYSTTVIHIH